MPVRNNNINDLLDRVMVEAHRVRVIFEDNAEHAFANGAVGIAGDDTRRASIITHAIALLEFARYHRTKIDPPELLSLLDELVQYAESSTLEGDELPDCASNALVLCDFLLHDPAED